jgi:TonB family protein
MPLALCARGRAQQTLSVAIEQPHAQIAALAERLGAQLLAANKKKPFILDLTLPDDVACPLGAWLADKLSESLAQHHPELEVIPRNRWDTAHSPEDPTRDLHQLFAQNGQRAQSLGAEVWVRGNFAAISGGIGITLMASDRLATGPSRFEVLAEIPITPDMQAMVTTALPQRPDLHGAFKASIAGIGSPLCEVCPPPEYTYVARAKKFQGIVIARLRVTSQGTVESVKIIHAPNSALADAAIRGERDWRFKPAQNSQGEPVPVVVEVAASFRLGMVAPRTSSAGSATAMTKKF